MRCVLLFLAAVLLTAADDNLVTNGDFEKAERDGKHAVPAAWSRPDRITSHYDPKGGAPRRCIRFDTSVLQIDKEKFAAAAEQGEEFAGRGRTSRRNQYQTVGAHEGVWLYSAPIDLPEEQRYYLISADVKGPAKSTALFYPQVFIRGYQRVTADDAGRHTCYFFTPHEGGPAYAEQFGKDDEKRDTVAGDWVDVYRHSLVCRLPDGEHWHHFQMGVRLPENPRYRPERILLKCYAMWPLGEYRFDNIVFRPCTKAEYEEAKRNKHSIKGFMKTE